jgi:hypothetical protein
VAAAAGVEVSATALRAAAASAAKLRNRVMSSSGEL